MKNAAYWRGRIDEFGDLVFSTVIKTLLLEIAPVLTPIIIIVAVTTASGKKDLDIPLMPEWGFASVVLFAAALQRFVALKVFTQKDQSEKLFLGSQFLAYGLLFSAVTLGLVVATEQGLKLDTDMLGRAQLTLFAFAVFFLVTSVFSGALVRQWRTMLPNRIGTARRLAYFADELRITASRLSHAEWAMESDEPIDLNAVSLSQLRALPRLEEILSLADRIERSARALNNKIKSQTESFSRNR